MLGLLLTILIVAVAITVVLALMCLVENWFEVVDWFEWRLLDIKKRWG